MAQPATGRLNPAVPRPLRVEAARLLGVPLGELGDEVQQRLPLYKMLTLKAILRVSKNMMPASRVRISGNKSELVRRIQALYLADRAGAVVSSAAARTNIALRQLGNAVHAYGQQQQQQQQHGQQQQQNPYPPLAAPPPPPKPPFDVQRVLDSASYLHSIDPRLTRAATLGHSYGRTSGVMRGEFTISAADCERVRAGTHSVVLVLYDGLRGMPHAWEGLRLAVNYVPIFPPQRRGKLGRKCIIVPAPHVPHTALHKDGKKNVVSVSGWMGRNLLLVVEFVQVSTIDQLLTRVPMGAEPKAAAESDDLIVADTVVSTKCPLSMVRIGQPAKGKDCTHHQCFDLRNYVDFCCRNGVWYCIVCDRRLPFGDLIVCPFFTRVLRDTPTHNSRVLIRHDFTFSAAPEESPRTPRTRKVLPEATPGSSSGGGNGGASSAPAEGAGDGALVILSDSDDDEPATLTTPTTTTTPNGAVASRTNAPSSPVVTKLETGAAAAAAPAPMPAPVDDGAIYIDSEDDNEEYQGPPPRQAARNPFDDTGEITESDVLLSLLRTIPGQRRWCNNCMTFH